MSIWSTNLPVALLAPIFLSVAPASGQVKRDSETPKRYESPTAVFDAYRQAYRKRDEGRMFSLLTPKAQDEDVVATFCGCMEMGGTEGTKERGIILAKH